MHCKHTSILLYQIWLTCFEILWQYNSQVGPNEQVCKHCNYMKYLLKVLFPSLSPSCRGYHLHCLGVFLKSYLHSLFDEIMMNIDFGGRQVLVACHSLIAIILQSSNVLWMQNGFANAAEHLFLCKRQRRNIVFLPSDDNVYLVQLPT